jgi:two-component system sensor histidine kinase/response regulator
LFLVARGQPSALQGMVSQLAGMSVLVVDDNPTALNTLKSMLMSLGLDVSTASRGDTALELVAKARRKGRPFQVALVDWRMPGLDGLAVIHALHHLDGGLQRPVCILVSAHEQAEAQLAQGVESPDAVLMKPTTPSSLLDTLLTVLRTQPAPMDAHGDVGDQTWVARGMRALVVDDNTINQVVACEMLRALGADVEAAGSGEEALACLQRSKPFDLIFMDVQMPEMDGYEATRRVRAMGEAGRLPIIAMTANAISGDREKCLAAGMDDYISKPVDPVALQVCVRRWATPDAASERDAQETSAGIAPGSATDLLEALSSQLAGFDLKGALARLCGRTETLIRLLRVFVDTNRDAVAALKAHQASGDMAGLAAGAHALRGAASSIGMDVMSHRLQQLEDRASLGADGVQLTTLLQEVEHDMRALDDVMQRAVISHARS